MTPSARIGSSLSLMRYMGSPHETEKSYAKSPPNGRTRRGLFPLSEQRFGRHGLHKGTVIALIDLRCETSKESKQPLRS